MEIPVSTDANGNACVVINPDVPTATALLISTTPMYNVFAANLAISCAGSNTWDPTTGIFGFPV